MTVVVEIFIIRKALLKEMRWCSKIKQRQSPILEEVGNLVLLQPEGRCVEGAEFKNKQPDNARRC